MFELVKFVRYALRFEKAFKTDDWTAVRRCFHDDAIYIIEGGQPPYDGETRGADAIMALFQDMLTRLDRRFDRRIPRLAAWPRSKGGVVTLRWRVRYEAGAEQALLTGTSVCTFEDGKIRRLQDTMIPDEVANWIAVCERAGKPLAN